MLNQTLITALESMDVSMLSLFEDTGKQCVKALARSTKTNGANETCIDIVSKAFQDDIMQDITSEIALYILENCNDSNIGIASYVYGQKIHFVYGDFQYNSKMVSGFLACCAIVRKYLEKNHSIKCNMVIDDFENWEYNHDTKDYEKTIISANDKKAYIGAVSNTLTITGETRVNESIKKFLMYVNEKYPKIAYEAMTIVKGLVASEDVRTICEKNNISETRGYYVMKRLKIVYREFNPIERKTIEFMPIVHDGKVNGYKRVFSESVKMDIGGKKSTTTIYKDHAGNVVEIPYKMVSDKLTKCNVKKYVVNMTKHAQTSAKNENIITTYIPYHVSNEFCYSDCFPNAKQEVLKQNALRIRVKKDKNGEKMHIQEVIYSEASIDARQAEYQKTWNEYRVSHVKEIEKKRMQKKRLEKQDLEYIKASYNYKSEYHVYESKKYKDIFKEGKCISKELK